MNFKVADQLGSHQYNDICDITSRPLPWKRFSGKTILITGANGFIGFYLVSALLELNDKYDQEITVLALVRNAEKAEAKFGALLSRKDITLIVQDVCKDLKTDSKADFIIHAASQASAWYYENDPVGTLNANLLGTSKILQYAARCHAAVLFISSLKVYGALHNGSTPISEENIGYIDHTNYKNCYAQGKRAAENICACYIKQHGLNIKIARPSYIYGASSLNDDRVWAQFIANVVKKENVILKSSGNTFRSFCYVSDTAAALFTILLNGANGSSFNIASKNSNISIRDFALEATQAFPDRGLKLQYLNKADRSKTYDSFLKKDAEILDASKLKALGWEAWIGIREGIKKAVQILEEQ